MRPTATTPVLVLLAATACSAPPGAPEAAPGPAVSAPECGDLALPAVFGDHMVLQRDSDVAFWGRARPGSVVAVRAPWLEAAVEATADDDGRWETAVPTPGAGGPWEVVVACGGEVRRLADVLVGEVWVCGGQSNMEWTLGPGVGPGVEGWEEAVAAADLPELRMFDVQRAWSVEPQDDCIGEWRAASPETAGSFSAVGFFFGRELLEELDCPVGLVGCKWGGTRAEAWTSLAGLEPLGAFDETLAKVRAARADGDAFPSLESLQRAWWTRLEESEPGMRAGWHRPDFDDSGWQTAALPGLWEDHGLADHDGLVWYRRTVDVPEEWAGRALVLELGGVDDQDATWFDGARVGGLQGTGVWNTPRRYVVPGELVRPGPRTIAVLALDTGGAGGFNGSPADLRLGPEGGDEALPLAGAWRWAAGPALGDLEPFPSTGWFHHNAPTALSSGMLEPIVPYGIRGAIFYQGESNRQEADLYRRLFPAMIADWRARWGRGDFPFYYVQIAPFGYGGDTGQAGALRDAQRRALAVPNTGMAVTMDVGDPRDIHPRKKREVGERLARWALARTYGREGLSVSGPLYRGMTVQEASVRVAFDHADGGLVARGGMLTDFEVRGADGVWHEARAEIRDDEVVVWNELVYEPVAVRYGWAAASEPNLFNGVGLPASTFTSED